MRKLIWIVGLLLFVFVGDRVGGWLLSRVVAKSQFRYSRLYEGAAQADILLVGNSRGLIFFQPYIEEITGKSTFNMSYNGLPMDVAAAMIEDYFERYEAPEVMVLDVTMSDRINKGLASGFSVYAPYSENLQNYLRDSIPNTYWAGQVSHLYRYNTEVFQRALFYLKKSDKDWITDRVINDNMVAGSADLEPYTISLEHENYLRSVIELAEAKGTEVRLVINPYYPAFANSMTNLREFKDRVETITGKKVHDYSRAIAEQKGFGDYQHLNIYGSQLYLDQLLADKILW